MKTIHLKFNGYWSESFNSFLPGISGIYCVFACRVNRAENALVVERLLYIGAAEDINLEISTHELFLDWLKQLKANETICYSYAAVGKNELKLISECLIAEHRPLLNPDHSLNHVHEDIVFCLSGDIEKLHGEFTVRVKPNDDSACYAK